MSEQISENKAQKTAQTISVAPLKLTMPGAKASNKAPAETANDSAAPETPAVVPETDTAPGNMAIPDLSDSKPVNSNAPAAGTVEMEAVAAAAPVDPDTVFEWDNQPAPRRRRGKLRRRWPQRLLKTLIVLLLLLAALFFLTVEFNPAGTVPENPVSITREQRDQLLGTLRQSLDKNTDQSVLTLEIPEEDLNTVFAAVMDKNNRSDAPGAPKIFGEWKNGRFEGAVSIQYGKCYFTLRFAAVPVWADNKLTVDIHYARLGVLPLPSAMLEKILQKNVLDCLEASTAYLNIVKPLQKFEFKEDGTLLIAIDNNDPPPPIYSDEILDNMELAPAERLNECIDQALANNQKRCTIVLSREELTKLIADRAFEWETQQKQPNDPYFYGEWKSDGLHLIVTYAATTEAEKPYPRDEEADLIAEYPGVHFNMTLVVKPELVDRKLELEIRTFKLGKIELPADELTEAAAGLIEDLETSEGYQSFLDKIIALRQLDNGSVEITLDPEQTQDLFRSQDQ